MHMHVSYFLPTFCSTVQTVTQNSPQNNVSSWHPELSKGPQLQKSQTDLGLDDKLFHTKGTCGFILFVWPKISREVQHPLLGLGEAEGCIVIEGKLGLGWEALTPVFSTLRRAQRADPLVAIFGGSGRRLLPWDAPVTGGWASPSSGRLRSLTARQESYLAIPRVWFPRGLPQGVGFRDRA